MIFRHLLFNVQLLLIECIRSTRSYRSHWCCGWYWCNGIYGATWPDRTSGKIRSPRADRSTRSTWVITWIAGTTWTSRQHRFV